MDDAPEAHVLSRKPASCEHRQRTVSANASEASDRQGVGMNRWSGFHVDGYRRGTASPSGGECDSSEVYSEAGCVRRSLK